MKVSFLFEVIEFIAPMRVCYARVQIALMQAE